MPFLWAASATRNMSSSLCTFRVIFAAPSRSQVLTCSLFARTARRKAPIAAWQHWAAALPLLIFKSVRTQNTIFISSSPSPGSSSSSLS